MKTFAVDFDGTIVTHEFPMIGKVVNFGGLTSFDVIKMLKENGHTVILWTMRGGDYLKEAVAFCKENGIVFDHVNQNPSQLDWTDSPKCYADHYIDDAAIGAHLIQNKEISQRPFVNWSMIKSWLSMNDFL